MVNLNFILKKTPNHFYKKRRPMKNNITLLFCLLISLLSMPVMALNNVTASIDKNPAVVNESIVLTVVADDDVKANALDTRSLMKAFIVGRTSVRTQTSMVNFSTSRTTVWTTVLIAREAGNVTIPAFTIENKQTQPIKLKVLAANDPVATKQKNIFIDSSLSSTDIYVQQQVTLSVKLYFSAELRRGNLSEPSLEGANISQVGSDKESDQIINGKRYRVIERTYAISPQKSGDFVVQSPRFSGEIMMPSTRRSNFLSFGETKPVSIIGDNIKLTVHPIPVTYQGHWLPSELISLHQEWQPNVNNTANTNDANNQNANVKSSSQFMVGEPVTRTITLTAAGLSKEQLPKLNMQVPEGLKVYPDQVELHSSMPNSRLVSQAVRSFAIVASRAGTFELPEIVIPWWNTITNRQEKAIIAAQTITVIQNPNQQLSQAFNNNRSENNQTISVCPENNIDNTTNTLDTEPKMIIKESWIQWLYLALWLITSAAWFISIQINKSAKNAPLTTQPINDHYLALLAACKQQQGEKTLSLIVPWVNTLLSDNAVNTKGNTSVSSIDEAIKAMNNNEFSDAIKQLQQTLYGKPENNAVWHSDVLIKLIQQLNKQGLKQNRKKDFSINP